MNLINTSNSYYELYKWKIEKGDILVSKKIKLMFNYVDSILDLPNIELNLTKGHLPIEFIEQHCRHSEAEWSGKLFTLSLWQKVICELLFGIVNTKTNQRHFTKMLVIVARKNGKSMFIAALCLYALVADGENGAKIYCAATNKEQAKIVFKYARNSIYQDPILKKLLKVRQTDIEFPESFSEFRPLAADSDNLDGYSPSMAIVDELHAHKTSGVYEKLNTGIGARRQPLLIIITTAGTIRGSIYDDIYTLAQQVLIEKFNPKDPAKFLPFIYELDQDGDWNKEVEWIKANPNLGISKKWSSMREELKEAKINDSAKTAFLTLHCNRPQTGSESFIDLETILQNKKRFDLKKLKGAFAWGGIDLSHTTDLTAGVIIATLPEDKTLYVIPQGFMCAQQLKKLIKSDKVSYGAWEKRGLVKVVGDGYIDDRAVVDWFKEMRDKYKLNIQKIGIDRYSATSVMTNLRENKFIVDKVAQGFVTFSKPMDEFKGMLREGKIAHNANPLYEWNIQNVVLVMDSNGNKRPDKKSAGTSRIDLFVATLNALVVMEESQQKVKWIYKLRKQAKDEKLNTKKI